MRFLPRYFRRRVLIARARELLAAGDPRGALAILSDPIFDGSPVAADLTRAAELHVASLPVDGPSAAIRDLLARMRAEKRAHAAATEPRADRGASDGSTTTGARTDREAHAAPRAGRAARLRLAIDDAGEYLVVAGHDFVLGHAASRRADVEFLADVEAEHARIVLVTDFTRGAHWRLFPIDRAVVRVAERVVEDEGTSLKDGDLVALAPQATFRFRANDPASASAVLELHHGLECRGAPRVLLFAPGAEGRVRIGAGSGRLVRVTSLEADVALEWTPPKAERAGGGIDVAADAVNVSNANASTVDSSNASAPKSSTQNSSTPDSSRPNSGTPVARTPRLVIVCPGGVERASRVRGDAVSSAELELPPNIAERFRVGARPKGRAPFEIVITNADDERDELR